MRNLVKPELKWLKVEPQQYTSLAILVSLTTEVTGLHDIYRSDSIEGRYTRKWPRYTNSTFSVTSSNQTSPPSQIYTSLRKPHIVFIILHYYTVSSNYSLSFCTLLTRITESPLTNTMSAFFVTVFGCSSSSSNTNIVSTRSLNTILQ